MRIGLSSIYSFRPHVEHMYYVATLLKRAGHEVYFLTCDASLTNCYSRSLKGKSKISECAKCMVGGIRSYPVDNIQAIRSKERVSLSEIDLENIATSSACTILRTESSEDLLANEFLELRNSFYEPCEVTYGNTIKWIREKNLEGVICFNGRMEVTRAITFACEKLGIPYLTQERTWFSHGLQFNANSNCLSLKDVSAINIEYRDKPLTRLQAESAAKLIAARFVRKNLNEWRAYNLNSENTSWPLKGKGGLKVLILPSSYNEFQGHPDWKNGWLSSTQAFDWALEKLNVKSSDIILRCHPNWAEKIGKKDGSKSQQYYIDWCKKAGIHYIESSETANTFDLIQECDVLLVNGSSAALEAGACGKKIICLGHSTYEDAGFALHITEEKNINLLDYFENHDPVEVIRKTLRFAYSMFKRFPQYVDFVKAKTTTSYDYFDGADAEFIIKMLKNGKIEAYDDVFAKDTADEVKIIDLIIKKEWALLSEFEEASLKSELVIKRRFGLQWVDDFRNKLPKGDL